MTRNDFIQQAVLAAIRHGANSVQAVDCAVNAANKLEEKGVTWDIPVTYPYPYPYPYPYTMPVASESFIPGTTITF